MPANFIEGKTILNGSVADLPKLYSNNISGGVPPYTISDNANIGKYINIYVSNSYESQGIVTRTNSNILWFKHDGSMVEPWRTIVNNNDDITITRITFSNGNYVNIQYEKTTPGFRLTGYLKNNTLIAQQQYLWQGTIMTQSRFTDVCLAIMTDGSSNFGALIVLENGSGYNRIQITQMMRGFNGNRANEVMFSDVNPLTDPYDIAPDSVPAGGFGDFDYSGDEIDFDALPTISVADSGFVTLFNPTEGQLKSLAQYMWSGLFDIATFRKIFADPMDCIIGLSIVPVTPPTGTAKELKVGNIGTGLSFNPLSSQFVEVDFKSLNIGLRTNSFMDFAPYTKCQIYLPFCGTFSLSVDDVCDADLILKYKIDLFTGACTASIKVIKTNSDGATLKSVLYQFSGNVSANIPFTSTNYNGFLQGILGAVGAVAGIATGGAGITAAGAVSAINGAMSMKPEIERSGNLAATSGFLGKQKPYLIMQYPHLCKPSGRDKTVGTPSFIGLSANKKLNSYHGLTSLHKVNVKGIPCTEDERVMIESALLTEGVILP